MNHSLAHHVVDFVFLEQEFDPSAHLIGYGTRAAHDLFEIKGNLPATNAEFIGMQGRLISFRTLEQGFRRYATPIQAGAARAFHFQAKSFFAQLTGANGSGITSGATSKNNQIVGSVRIHENLGNISIFLSIFRHFVNETKKVSRLGLNFPYRVLT